MNIALWTIQVLLAVLFLLTGVLKLALPVSEMTRTMGLPGSFVRFLGVAEIAGAMGLILPWLLRIRRELTPIAAACLIVIMCGAVVLTIRTTGAQKAAMPFVVGLLLIFVAYRRWQAISAAGRPGQDS